MNASTKEQKNRNVLVTGGAGFIGSHLVDGLLSRGDRVTVLDNFNDYYNPANKRANVATHLTHPNYALIEGDIRNEQDLDAAFQRGTFDVVVHLAAMAGVRPSLSRAAYYMDVNVSGTQKIIDRIVNQNPKTRLVFGSSSSVYGARSGEMFREDDRVDMPLSPYAASKAANEVQCYAAHHTTGLPVVCLRFFTVFGPRQRPDLAIHKFCELIDEGTVVQVYGDGTSKRDYTFVGDIVTGIQQAMTFDSDGWEIINLGRSEPVVLIDMIKLIERFMEKPATLEYAPMPPGDVPYTYANVDKARKLLGYQPATSFEEGVRQFVEWYRSRKASRQSVSV